MTWDDEWNKYCDKCKPIFSGLVEWEIKAKENLLKECKNNSSRFHNSSFDISKYNSWEYSNRSRYRCEHCDGNWVEMNKFGDVAPKSLWPHYKENHRCQQMINKEKRVATDIKLLVSSGIILVILLCVFFCVFPTRLSYWLVYGDIKKRKLKYGGKRNPIKFSR